MNKITKNLNKLLQDSGSSYDATAVEALIQGIAAAPIAIDDEWLALVSEAPSVGLKTALLSMLDEAASSNCGLDGERTQANRIAALRKQMSEQQVDGFIVPRCDAHQGEYVSLNSERLAWLTGFTGSAGMAIVLKQKAAIFVDGRYTLQAQAEVDETLFEICPINSFASLCYNWCL